MMNIMLSRDVTRRRTPFSNIQVYYNRQFPLEDILDVLYPLFHIYYPYKDFVHMIYTSNHIFCAYDKIQRRSIACALVNNAGSKGGLYLMLFGVRQSSQHHGVGTHLLASIIQWARQTNHTFIYLHVNVDNVKAIGLYKKVGFRKHEYLPNYYGGTPKENPDGIRMILSFR
jgi:ribosomal protein S18 acetylase RimI-like enzyme